MAFLTFINRSTALENQQPACLMISLMLGLECMPVQDSEEKFTHTFYLFSSGLMMICWHTQLDEKCYAEEGASQHEMSQIDEEIHGSQQ